MCEGTIYRRKRRQTAARCATNCGSWECLQRHFSERVASRRQQDIRLRSRHDLLSLTMATIPYPPPVLTDAPAASTSKSGAVASAFSPVKNVFNRFSSWRASLGLPSPGSIERLATESKSMLSYCHTAHYMDTNMLLRIDTIISNPLDGARADLSKILSVEPAFQVTHSFQLASQTQPSAYYLSTVYAASKVCISLFILIS